MEIALDGEPVDPRAASTDDFYARLRGGAEATTSQPSPAAFAEAYERAAAAGAEGVVSIHLDARVSGTVSAAERAADDAPLSVTVVDAGTVSFGVGVCVRKAAAVVAAGGSEQDASRAVIALGSRLQSVFVARAGGGRIPATSDWTLWTFVSGAAASVSSCSGIKEAVDSMSARVLCSDWPVSVAVGHAAREVEAAADELAHQLVRSSLVLAVERYRVGPAVGAHTGPDSFGAFWWPDA